MTDEQIKRLVRGLEEQIHVLTKARDDLQTLLNSVEGKQPVKDVLTHFDHQWRRFYAGSSAERYEFTAIDAATVKRWLKTADVPTIKTRISNYFNDRDDFIVKQKHPFSMLTARYNRYKVDRGLHPWAGDIYEAGPVDCAHDPPCDTDAMHTERRRADLRGIADPDRRQA